MALAKTWAVAVVASGIVLFTVGLIGNGVTYDETNHAGAGVGDAGPGVHQRAVVDVVALLARLELADSRLAAAGAVLGDAAGPTPAPVDAGEPTGEPEPPAVVEPVNAAGCDAGPIERIVCAYDWDDATAIRTFSCESGTDPVTGVMDGAYAVGNGSYGVAQIQDVHAAGIPDFWEHWMIPEFNIAWAYGIWRDWQNRGLNGWLQWTCY